MKILVIGGTGQVGSAVVTELLRRRAELRLFVRNERSSVPRGVEVAVGDLLDPPAVERAMAGAGALYLLNAVTPDELTQGLVAYDLARRSKLRRIVYHSVFRADRFRDVPHFASKAAIEAALRAFDVPWTVIRPNYFFQNDAQFREPLSNGIYPVPLGQTGVSAIDVRDIAEATAIALTSDGHDGKVYNLNGPQPISGPHAAALWSEVLGKTVRYAGDDLDAFEANMRKQSPPWSAFDMRMMFEGYLERGFVAEPRDIETLTSLLGHGPRTYEAFVRETVSHWTSSTEAS